MPMWVANHAFTKSHTVSRILSMVGAGPYYFSISRTSRWNDVPPTPLFTDTLIPSEVLVYKKAYKVMAAFRNPCGLEVIDGEHWSLVHPSEVILHRDGTYTPDITHMYVALLVEEGDHRAPYSNVLGLHTGLQLTLSANPGSPTYPPSMVSSSGILHWLSYTSPIYTRPRMSQVLHVLISF